MDDIRDLRKKDIITGILLFVFGAAMFATATTYPMSESYGGVKNVWYASPALFPMIIASLLVIFAVILIANGVCYLLKHPRKTVATADRWRRLYPLLFITATLIVFVYFYIPAVDFWIASLIYLYLFITHFYIHDTFSLTASGAVFVGVGVLMHFLGAMTEMESLTAQFWRDGLCTAYFIGFVIYTFHRVKSRTGGIRPAKIVLNIVLATMTIIVIGFKFGVLIPMPREGVYCYYLDQLYFFMSDFLK